MRQSQILIDSLKDGADGHQMDQIMGKTACSAKIKTSVFLKWSRDHLKKLQYKFIPNSCFLRISASLFKKKTKKLKILLKNIIKIYIISAGRGRHPQNWNLSSFSTVTHSNLFKKNRLVAWTLASGKGVPLPPSHKSGGDVAPEKRHFFLIFLPIPL